MRTTKLIMTVLTLAMTLGAGAGYGVQTKPEPIYGSQLMTAQERMDYRARLRSATTAAERERIRLEHHQAMQARAQARGQVLPDTPPAMGGGMGPGPGPGMGAGGGRNR